MIFPNVFYIMFWNSQQFPLYSDFHFHNIELSHIEFFEINLFKTNTYLELYFHTTYSKSLNLYFEACLYLIYIIITIEQIELELKCLIYMNKKTKTKHYIFMKMHKNI